MEESEREIARDRVTYAVIIDECEKVLNLHGLQPNSY
jgi:hypothetical protein